MMPAPFPEPSDPAPRWVSALALGGTALVVVGVAIAALLLGRGAADPPLAGTVTWADRVMTWAQPAGWSAAPADALIPADAFTLDVRARQPADAGPLAAWGVWLAADDGTRVIYALSAAGYITTRACPADTFPPAALEDCPAVRAEWRWSPYPRVNSPGSANTITLHRESSGAIRLRLNGEQLGVWPVQTKGGWGVWAREAAPVWDSAVLWTGR